MWLVILLEIILILYNVSYLICDFKIFYKGKGFDSDISGFKFAHVDVSN